MKKVLILACEPSADLHAEALLKELVTVLKEQKKEASFSGIGGEYLKATGHFVLEYDNKELAVMGLTEIFSSIVKIKKVYSSLKKKAKYGAYDLAILVDYAGANIPFAKYLTNLGIPVIYYIPPKVWWRSKNRIYKLQKYTSKIVGILPNELDFYKKRNVELEYFGNPLIERVNDFLNSYDPKNDPVFKDKDDSLKVAILLGSRNSELYSLAPTIKEVLKILIKKYPNMTFYFPLAQTFSLNKFKEVLGMDEFYNKKIFLLDSQDASYRVFASCNYGIVASGTATLESALFKLPAQLIYKISKISYLAYKLFVDDKRFIGLPNILLNKEVYKEKFQAPFTVDNVVSQLEEDLFNEDRKQELKQDLDKLYKSLSINKKPSRKVAELVAEYI